MARTILITFADNEEADKLIAEHIALRTQPSSVPIEADAEQFLGGLLLEGVIEAVVAKPTKACHCRAGFGKMTSRGSYGWTQTRRFGWWVHAKCMKPSQGVVNKFIANMLNGNRNLLVEFLPPEEEDRCAQPMTVER